MSNPYISTTEWFNNYRAGQATYDYRNSTPWPEDCPIWIVLAPGDDMPRRDWADHQATEITDNPYDLPVYACHPYQLSTDALQDLLALERAGFTVYISGHSEYHPSAIRVEIHPTLKHFESVDHFDAQGRPVPIDEHIPEKAITLIPASEWPADKPFPIVGTPFSGPGSRRK